MQQQLTDQERYVLFDGGTEPAFSGKYLDEKRQGIYACKNCGLEIFSSQTKYDSGSGWPSFTKPTDFKRVTLLNDDSLGMTRVEVRCAKCNAHLGHVFPDGPKDAGGDRYCVNSLSLEFNEKQS